MKKTLAFILSVITVFSSFGGLFVFSQDEIVKDGLVAWYDGEKNTEDGHNADSLVWEDLVGDNDVTVVKDEKNYFQTKHIILIQQAIFFLIRYLKQ